MSWSKKLDPHEMICNVVDALLPERMGWVLFAIHPEDEYQPIVMSANVGLLPSFLRMAADVIEKNDYEMKMSKIKQ